MQPGVRHAARCQSDDQRSAWVLARGLDTVGKMWAQPTISGGTLDLDPVVMALAAEPAPTGTRFPEAVQVACRFSPSRTNGTSINARWSMGLPLRINGHWTHEPFCQSVSGS